MTHSKCLRWNVLETWSSPRWTHLSDKFPVQKTASNEFPTLRQSLAHVNHDFILHPWKILYWQVNKYFCRMYQKANLILLAYFSVFLNLVSDNPKYKKLEKCLYDFILFVDILQWACWMVVEERWSWPELRMEWKSSKFFLLVTTQVGSSYSNYSFF